MYSRWQEETLNYIRASLSQRCHELHKITREVNGEDDDIDDIEHNELPASFLGSRRYQSECCVDALALARAKGRASFFATATANVHWPEIQSQLPRGANVTDYPELVCRVFQARLKHLLSTLRTKFGNLLYLIRVVEFQKRGLPHAHIIFAVSCISSHFEWKSYYY
jgi:Helitron helicase-like domain at N-terminus